MHAVFDALTSALNIKKIILIISIILVIVALGVLIFSRVMIAKEKKKQEELSDSRLHQKLNSENQKDISGSDNNKKDNSDGKVLNPVKISDKSDTK